MGLDLTAEVQWREIQNDLKLRREITNSSMNIIRNYAGNTYKSNWGQQYENYETHNFEWVANAVPNLIMFNPKVRTTDMGIVDEETEALDGALRSLLPQIRFAQELRSVAVDMQFDFGVTIVASEPTPGLKNPSPDFQPLRPVVKRISPRMYFRDARSPEFGRVRREGHICIGDIEDMKAAMVADPKTGQQKPKFDHAALESIIGGMDPDVRRDLMQDGVYVGEDDTKTVVYYEFFVPEEKAWFCLAAGNSVAAYIREEREYSGPSKGPYRLWGTYIVPDQVYPLANLAVTHKQVEELNRHRAQAAADAGTAKRLAIVNGQSQGVIANLQDAPSGSVLSIPGFNGTVEQFEFGGAMKESYEHIQYAKGHLDRTSGLSETQRGDITGATATEIDKAQSASDVRTRYSQNKFKEDTVEVLSQLVDLMDSDVNIVFPCPVVDPQSGQKVRGTFYGGRDENEQDPSAEYPFKRSVTIEIEPYSMEYVNESMLRMQSMQMTDEFLGKLAPAAMQFPFMKVKAIADDLAQHFNIPDGGKRYIDYEMLQALQQRAVQASSQGPPPDPIKVSLALNSADLHNPVTLSMLEFSNALPPGAALEIAKTASQSPPHPEQDPNSPQNKVAMQKAKQKPKPVGAGA